LLEDKKESGLVVHIETAEHQYFCFECRNREQVLARSTAVDQVDRWLCTACLAEEMWVYVLASRGEKP
jgi:hypothetical protein